MASDEQNQPALSGILDTGKYSDLKMDCNGHVFNVHKAIICAQSKPFAAMVDTGRKKTYTTVIELPDDDPAIVKRVLAFMYTSNYDGVDTDLASGIASLPQDNAPEDQAAQAPITLKDKGKCLIINAKVYICAEKWDIPALERLAAKKYKQRVCHNYLIPRSNFIESMQITYDETPEDDRLLKNIMIRVAVLYIQLQTRSLQPPLGPELAKIISEDGDVAIDLIVALDKSMKVMPMCRNKHCASWKSNRYVGARCKAVIELDSNKSLYYCAKCEKKFD